MTQSRRGLATAAELSTSGRRRGATSVREDWKIRIRQPRSGRREQGVRGVSYLVAGPCVLGGVLPLLSLSCIQDNLWEPPQMKQISIRISASLRHVNFAMVTNQSGAIHKLSEEIFSDFSRSSSSERRQLLSPWAGCCCTKGS